MRAMKLLEIQLQRKYLCFQSLICNFLHLKFLISMLNRDKKKFENWDC